MFINDLKLLLGSYIWQLFCAIIGSSIVWVLMSWFKEWFVMNRKRKALIQSMILSLGALYCINGVKGKLDGIDSRWIRLLNEDGALTI